MANLCVLAPGSPDVTSYRIGRGRHALRWWSPSAAGEFAFIVGGSYVRWGYTFTPVEGGTSVTESWEFLPGGLAMFEERFGADAQAQIANRAEAARTGIPATLAAIKRIAEAG